jgi:hypothetical protein
VLRRMGENTKATVDPRDLDKTRSELQESVERFVALRRAWEPEVPTDQTVRDVHGVVREALDFALVGISAVGENSPSGAEVVR